MSKRSVLLVDDDAQFSHIFCARMRLIGLHTECAGTLAEMTDRLTERQYDVIILDLHLPDATAEKTVAAIGLIRPWALRALVVITGSLVTEKLSRVCLAGGADAIISKDGGDFWHTIERFVTS